MNIGQRIYEVMCEKGCSASWLAERVPCERSNIYNIFRRKSVGADLLFILSSLLHHDFFAELSEEWQQMESGNKQFETENKREQEEESEQLEAESEQIETENNADAPEELQDCV